MVGGRTCSASGQRAEGHGPTEDDDGEGRELGRGESRRIIFAAEAAEEMDGDGMQPVGESGAGAA